MSQCEEGGASHGQWRPSPIHTATLSMRFESDRIDFISVILVEIKAIFLSFDAVKIWGAILKANSLELDVFYIQTKCT